MPSSPRPSQSTRQSRRRSLEKENATLRAILIEVMELEAAYRSVLETHRVAGYPAHTDPTADTVEGVSRVVRKIRKLLGAADLNIPLS